MKSIYLLIIKKVCQIFAKVLSIDFQSFSTWKTPHYEFINTFKLNDLTTSNIEHCLTMCRLLLTTVHILLGISLFLFNKAPPNDCKFSYQISLHLNALLFLWIGLFSAFSQGGVNLLGRRLLGFDDSPGDHALGKTAAVLRNRLKENKVFC